MLFGFLSALATYVFVPAGVAVGFVAFLLLRYEMFVVSFMAHFKYALVEVGHFSFFVTTGIYVAICAVLGVLYWRKEAKDEVLK